MAPRRRLMFARTKKVTRGDQEYHYVQIVEAYRDSGRPKQRVVASLGRLDLLGDKLDDLVSSLRKYCRKHFTLPDEMACQQALPWGTVLLTRHLWEQVNLSEIIGQFCRSPRKRYNVAETAFVLVANRLCEPRSEHGGWNIPLSVTGGVGGGNRIGSRPSSSPRSSASRSVSNNSTDGTAHWTHS